MKKINDYRKLLGVEKNTELKELKSIYRNMMKSYHPDKFVDDHDQKIEAEEKSKEIIEAYHFLVSISRETIEQGSEEFNSTLSSAGMVDFHFEKSILKVIYDNGNTYEFFGVPHKIYTKMVNSESYGRFVRRHISETYPYRNISKRVALAEV
ncbi:MAG: KTSC domain-containing protein [Flavobacteriales bacterium]|nr:KTSC domain-containing protein [Flavobacteriales bacterium]